MDIGPEAAHDRGPVGAGALDDVVREPAQSPHREDRQRGPAPVRRGSTAVVLSPARARLLEHLQQRPTSAGVEDLAATFAQHPNTLREHLEALVRSGLVLREREQRTSRGRPAWRYRANPHQQEPDPRVREYAALAGALAGHLAANSPDPPREAREAGRRWGRMLVGGSATMPPAGDLAPTPPARARRRVVALLADLDFTPLANAGATRTVLTTCPLLDVARRHAEVVCSVHEGMVGGALAALGAPDEQVSLTPFAAPDGCVLAMRRPSRARTTATAGG